MLCLRGFGAFGLHSVRFQALKERLRNSVCKGKSAGVALFTQAARVPKP